MIFFIKIYICLYIYTYIYLCIYVPSRCFTVGYGENIGKNSSIDKYRYMYVYIYKHTHMYKHECGVYVCVYMCMCVNILKDIEYKYIEYKRGNRGNVRIMRQCDQNTHCGYKNRKTKISTLNLTEVVTNCSPCSQINCVMLSVKITSPQVSHL